MTASRKQSPTRRSKIGSSLVVVHPIERKIHIIRGQKVILSTDLAALYKVEPRVLVQAVKRNINRFPRDFMFQLTAAETRNLKSQFVTSRWGGQRGAPYAFTEQGVAMLSSVLRSERAVKANIAIMRAFVRLREMLVTHEELRQKIEQMEKRYDAKFQIVFATIKEMLETPVSPKRSIGFHAQGRTIE
jgi:ORF6N domain-containing protein